MATANGSPSSSTSSASISSSTEANNHNPSPSSNSSNPIQSWWESVSKAQSRIHALRSLLASPSLVALAESDHPAHSLLNSGDAYLAVSAALSHPSSGSGDDPLCQWLYETYQSSDSDLRLVVLSFVPLLTGLYLSRVITSSHSTASGSAPSLAGFEAVILALFGSIFGSTVKARSGKPILISVPDLSQPSIYHTPTKPSAPSQKPVIGMLSPPLEPQIAVKSTMRASIIAIALNCYCSKISQMPACSKIDFCEFVSSWAGQDCPCRYEFDDLTNPSSSPEMRNSGEGVHIDIAAEEISRLAIHDRLNGECNLKSGGADFRRGSRVPLPWLLLQPALRILGHCLLSPYVPAEVRDAGSAAIRCVYARASHDVTSKVILAAQSLIKLDQSARKKEKDEQLLFASGPASNPNTPSKPKKPEVVPAAKKFRYAGIVPELEEDMNMMFNSVVATGVHACAPNTTSQACVSIDERAMSEHDNNPIDISENVDSVDASITIESRKRRKEKNKVISSSLIDLVESIKDISACLREPPMKTCPFSIAQTLKKVESYPEICKDYDFFDFATMLLMDKNHRETFMCLREEIRVKWLRTRYEKGSP